MDESPPTTPALEVPFARTPRAAHDARAALRRFLACGDATRTADAELVLSELVTNVVRHTEDGGHVRLRYEDGTVRMDVVDRDACRPTMRTAATGRPGGWGLHLVDALSTRWGVHAAPVGKAVWAEVDVGIVGLPRDAPAVQHRPNG